MRNPDRENSSENDVLGSERSALDLVSAGVVILESSDTDDPSSLRILYLNDFARSVAGLMPTVDVVGQSIGALGPLLQDPDARRAVVESIAVGDRRLLGDYHRTNPEGVYSLTASPIGEGRVVVTCDDVTRDRQIVSDMQRQTDGIQDARDQLDQIYRTAPVGLCLLDRDLRYVRINQLLADINNTPIDQHIGKTIAEVIPKLAPYIEPTYRQVLKTGEAITNVEIQTSIPRDGDDSKLRDWIVGCYPFFDANGDVRGVSVSVQEITEVKRAQRKESFLKGLLGGQERERSRIARELHDGVAQTVVGLALQLASLGQQCSEPLKEKVKGLTKLASSTAESLRQMSLALHPLMLDQLGLNSALRQHVTALDKHSTAKLTLQIEGERHAHPLPEEIALTVYRVCQEALANAIKHGRPKHVDAKVIWESRLLTLRVDDDGVGLDLDKISGDVSHLGITSMRERARLVKGSLTLGSRVGGGTALRLQIPLPEAADEINALEP